MSVNLKNILPFIIGFLLFFTFKVPIIYNSTFLIFIILSILFLLNIHKVTKNIIIILSNKKIQNILSFFILIILITFFTTVFHSKYDFSLLITLGNQLFNISIVLLFVSIFYDRKKGEFYFLNLILYCFALQGIIMICSLLFPSFKAIIEFTQSQVIIQKSLDSYGGFRNLAFGTTQFYGINAAMGIVLIFNAFMLAKYNKIKYLITFILIVVGIFFSGRTSMIAIALSFVMLLLILKIKRKYVIKSIVLLPFLLIAIYFSFNIFQKYIPESVTNWFFEIFINYEKTGKLESTSANAVLYRMHFIPEDSIVIFGTGQYTNKMGGYFMSTDAGFMRPLLYYGFIGVLLFTIYYFKILNAIYVYLNNIFPKKNVVYLFICLIIFSFLLNIKGEFMGFLIMSQNVFFMILFSLVLDYNGK